MWLFWGYIPLGSQDRMLMMPDRTIPIPHYPRRCETLDLQPRPR